LNTATKIIHCLKNSGTAVPCQQTLYVQLCTMVKTVLHFTAIWYSTCRCQWRSCEPHDYMCYGMVWRLHCTAAGTT